MIEVVLFSTFKKNYVETIIRIIEKKSKNIYMFIDKYVLIFLLFFI